MFLKALSHSKPNHSRIDFPVKHHNPSEKFCEEWFFRKQFEKKNFSEIKNLWVKYITIPLSTEIHQYFQKEDCLKMKHFECQLCPAKFGYKSRLTTHINLVHKKLKNFQCNICQSKFGLNSYLNRHNKTVHQQIKTFLCNICQSKFVFNYII